MRYRKKPVVIEAVQLTETEIVHTLEGDHRGDPGDWLITGVKGERYPCKPDIFEMTYEPADIPIVVISVEMAKKLSRYARLAAGVFPEKGEEVDYDIILDADELDRLIEEVE